jgi:hypothetical protein
VVLHAARIGIKAVANHADAVAAPLQLARGAAHAASGLRCIELYTGGFAFVLQGMRLNLQVLPLSSDELDVIGAGWKGREGKGRREVGGVGGGGVMNVAHCKAFEEIRTRDRVLEGEGPTTQHAVGVCQLFCPSRSARVCCCSAS